MLYNALKSFDDYQHPLESVWVVKSFGNANGIFQNLKKYIDENDYLLVINMPKGQDRQGWLQKTFWDWLKEKDL